MAVLEYLCEEIFYGGYQRIGPHQALMDADFDVLESPYSVAFQVVGAGGCQSELESYIDF